MNYFKQKYRNDKIYIQLSFSFYHQELEKFFGRTYTSSLINGKLNKGLFSANRIYEDMYYHSKEASDKVCLIADVLIIRKSKGNSEPTYYSGGYFLTDIFLGEK